MKRLLLPLLLLCSCAPALAQDSPRQRHRPPASSDPATGVTGDCYWNTSSSVLKCYTGSAWSGLGTVTGSGSSGRVALWSSSSAQTSDSGLTFAGAGSTFDLTVSRNVTAKAYVSAPQALTDGATVTWDLNAGQYATVTLGGSRTLSITNGATGKSGCLVITQDATGGRALTLPGGSKVSGGGAGAVTLSTAAGAVDVLCVLYVGSTPYFNLGANYN